MRDWVSRHATQERDKSLFRYRLIAPLLDPDLKRGDVKELLSAAAERTHILPDGREVKFSYETIRSWYKRYKKYGFEALKNKNRSDRGKSRAVPEDVIQKAVDLKLEVPQRSLLRIISILEKGKVVLVNTLKKSTLHRIFKQKHITARVPKEKGYWQRFRAEFPNDLWQSDQMFGPYLPDPGLTGIDIRTQLLAWLDDNSRVIPHAQFYYFANSDNLDHCLRKGIQKMGLPTAIYVDNGQIYSAKHIHTICASLGIRLMFAKPYSPEGKGKIERFFGYVRSSFLPELKTSAITTLEKLNEAFFAWLSIEHHNRIHSELKAAPMDVFLAHKDKIRYPTEEELKNAFLYTESRSVHKDCTFHLMGNCYEVMPALVGQKVEIRFDPDDLEVVKIYLAGDFFQQARILRLSPHTKPKQIQAEESKPVTGVNYLKNLTDEYNASNQELLFGPKQIPSDNRLTLSDLLTLLNRKGFHLLAFETAEVKKYFDTYGPFDKNMATNVLETLIKLKGTKQHISFYLQKLVDTKQNMKGEF